MGFKLRLLAEKSENAKIYFAFLDFKSYFEFEKDCDSVKLSDFCINFLPDQL